MHQRPVIEFEKAQIRPRNHRHVVGGHQHGGTLRIDLAQEQENGVLCTVVQISCRFVGQQDKRVVGQCPGNGDALLFTTGEFVRKRRGLRAQPDLREQARDLVTDLCLRRARDFQSERHVLFGGPIGEQPKILKHDAKPATQDRNLARLDRMARKAGDAQLARGRAFGHRQQLQQGALARATMAHQKHELPFAHLEGDVAQGRA